MPHLSVLAAESQLSGREADLVTRLTDAVVAVYGDWARPHTAVHLVGAPPGRWAVGGSPTESAPHVAFGIRAGALNRPDGAQIARRLVAGVTDAIVDVLGEDVRPTVTVELVPQHEDRFAVGGTLVAELG